ncbi:unnamed protein product [Lactuca virosa]|uniref:Uncharacterized protein n=1 Tax=Lactuca virosa TaxID=75947 RepID=A0AAU9PGG2_9ASTR|nr:unnamed protein product [Lactuca virosa]
MTSETSETPKSPIRPMASLEPVTAPVSTPNQPPIIMDNTSFLGDLTSLNTPISELWRLTPSYSMSPPHEFSTSNQQLASVFTQTSTPPTIQFAGRPSAFAQKSISPTLQAVGGPRSFSQKSIPPIIQAVDGPNTFAQTFTPLVNQATGGPSAFVQTSLPPVIQDTSGYSVFSQTSLITHTTFGSNSPSHTSAYLMLEMTNTLRPPLRQY